MLIYLIKNKINEKEYVGQTRRSLLHRWRQHCQRTQQPVDQAIQKYGKDNFEVKILAKPFSQKEMNLGEEGYVLAFNTLSPNGYNIRPGGDNHTVCPEGLARMSASQMGKHHTPKTKAKISAAFKGRSFSPEIRAKLSLSLMGHFVSEETRKKLSESHKGNSLSKEQKIKISLSLKDYYKRKRGL